MAIDIQSLEFRYDRSGFRLRVPELSVADSEKIAVIGPSGTGKTTLLKLIAGILPVATGNVVVGKTKLSELNDKKRRAFRIKNIGFVFQDFELLDYLDVSDNILHPYRISHALTLTRAVRNRAKFLANEMGIGSKLSHYINELSQGEKQRAAICRALLTEPKLILADEATGNLDPANKERILDLLFRVIENSNAALVAVTHDHELLGRFDRVVNFQDFINDR